MSIILGHPNPQHRQPLPHLHHLQSHPHHQQQQQAYPYPPYNHHPDQSQPQQPRTNSNVSNNGLSEYLQPKCDACCMTFNSVESLEVHLSYHKESRPWTAQLSSSADRPNSTSSSTTSNCSISSARTIDLRYPSEISEYSPTRIIREDLRSVKMGDPTEHRIKNEPESNYENHQNNSGTENGQQQQEQHFGGFPPPNSHPPPRENNPPPPGYGNPPFNLNGSREVNTNGNVNGNSEQVFSLVHSHSFPQPNSINPEVSNYPPLEFELNGSPLTSYQIHQLESAYRPQMISQVPSQQQPGGGGQFEGPNVIMDLDSQRLIRGPTPQPQQHSRQDLSPYLSHFPPQHPNSGPVFAPPQQMFIPQPVHLWNVDQRHEAPPGYSVQYFTEPHIPAPPPPVTTSAGGNHNPPEHPHVSPYNTTVRYPAPMHSGGGPLPESRHNIIGPSSIFNSSQGQSIPPGQGIPIRFDMGAPAPAPQQQQQAPEPEPVTTGKKKGRKPTKERPIAFAAGSTSENSTPANAPATGGTWKGGQPTRPKKFKCTDCNKSFTSSGHLKRHYGTTLHKNSIKQLEARGESPTTPPDHQKKGKRGKRQPKAETVTSPQNNTSPPPLLSNSFNGIGEAAGPNQHLIHPSNNEMSMANNASSDPHRPHNPLTSPPVTTSNSPFYSSLPLPTFHQISHPIHNQLPPQLSHPPNGHSYIFQNHPPTSHPSVYYNSNGVIPSTIGSSGDGPGSSNNPLPSFHLQFDRSNNSGLIPNSAQVTNSIGSAYNNPIQNHSPYIDQSRPSPPSFNPNTSSPMQSQEHQPMDTSSASTASLQNFPPQHTNNASFDSGASDRSSSSSSDRTISPTGMPRMTLMNSEGHVSDSGTDTLSPSESTTGANNTTVDGQQPQANKVFECHICHKHFHGACYLTQHINSTHCGTKPFRCDQCGKKFSAEDKFEEHVRKHADGKPFKCQYDQCNKEFHFKGDLNRHICLHTGKKEHQCLTCRKTFIRRDHMKKHYEKCVLKVKSFGSNNNKINSNSMNNDIIHNNNNNSYAFNNLDNDQQNSNNNYELHHDINYDTQTQ